MTNTRATAVAVLTCAALAVAACSSTSDATGGEGGGGDAAAPGSDQSDDGYVSPLNEFLGGLMFDFAGGGFSMTAVSGGGEHDEVKQRQVEALVAACMAEQGFEYVPRDPSDWNSSEYDEAYALPPDEFAERYGYGITTFDALGRDDDEEPDPNSAIRDGLSPEAQDAYDLALWGDFAGRAIVVERGDDDAATDDVVSIEDQGCYGEASNDVHGEPDAGGFVSFDDFSDLFTDLHALGQRIQADPRLVEPQQAWVDCMADAGYADFERPGDARESVFSLMSEPYGFGTADELDESETARDLSVLEADPEELAEARDYELAVATADFRCQEAHWTDAFRTVQQELESEFIDQHRAELEAYRDQQAQQGGAAG